MKNKRKVSDKVLFADLEKVANLLQQNTIHRRKYPKYGQFSAGRYVKRFGSWNNALLAAGLSIFEPDFGIPKKINASPRYRIFARDNFRCTICGRDSTDNIKLEVDHIVPVSKGGRTVYSNLRTLCFDCNRGKWTRT